MSKNILNVDAPLESFSKKDIASIDPVVASLAPVQLSEEASEEYNGNFFSWRKKGTQYPNNDDFKQLVDHFLNLSLGVNKSFEFLRFVLANGSRLEDLSPEDVGINLNNIVNTINLEQLDPKKHKNIIANLYGSYGAGSHHVIKDSKRYAGGKDIIFSGIPGSITDVKSGASFRVPSINRIQEIIPANNPGSYEQAKLVDYSTPLSKSVLKAANAINKFIMGEERTRSNIQKRKIIQAPFEKDFREIENIIKSYLGLKFDLNFFEKPNQQWATKFKGAFRLLTISDVPKTASGEWKKYYNAVASNDTSAPEPDNSQHTEEGILCSPLYSFSFAMNLKKDFVNYICQSEDGTNATYAIHIWIQSWSKLMLRAKGGSRGNLNLAELPRYVVPAAQVSKLAERRKAAGYSVDDGRVDESRITIAPTGGLMFMPKASDFDGKNAMAYETDMNAALEKQFNADVGATQNKTLTDEQIVAAEDGLIESEILRAKDGLKKYEGTLLNFSWDYNTLTSVSGRNPSTQLTSDLLGSTTPRALDIADYLGMDFADEGERPIRKDFADAMALMMIHIKPEKTSGDEFIQPHTIRRGGDGAKPGAEGGLLGMAPFEHLFATYSYLVTRKHVKSFADLVKMAGEELDINILAGNEIESGLYSPGDPGP